MKRNQDRTYYDKGYSDGVQDTKKESKIPVWVGVICLCILLVFDQFWVLGFVIIWFMFDASEWWDLNKWHESDPPDQWE